VVWVFPATVPKDQLNVDMFRQQLLDLGAISPKEAQSLVKLDGRIAGSIRGLPFQAVTLETLPDLDGPVVLHIDTGYFKPLYKGEIKTQLYPLLYNTLKALRSKAWGAVAATTSYSTTDRGLPLAVRFIGPTLTSLLKSPALLNQPMPLNWERRAKALYIQNFMQSEGERELYLKMEVDQPEDPSVKYALYQVSRKSKRGTAALDYLARAVEIDPGYAFEYLDLARIAEEKGLSEQALKMMLLINKALPDDPFITMQVATRLNLLGHSDQALQSVKKLQQLTWSKVYYPRMPERLEALAKTLMQKDSQ
jgi:tetratricopeptide (TPR) repeat protein